MSRRPIAYLLVGLTGSGKTTYAQTVLEPLGARRLSIDEAIFAEHGQYGLDYPTTDYAPLYDEALTRIRHLAAELLTAGQDVALDLGIWSRADRQEWKGLVERAGGVWQLLYLRVPPDELRRRLQHRNRESHANALPVSDDDFAAFVARFEEPLHEGERIIEP